MPCCHKKPGVSVTSSAAFQFHIAVDTNTQLMGVVVMLLVVTGIASKNTNARHDQYLAGPDRRQPTTSGFPATWRHKRFSSHTY